ncbi:zinc ribbon domain-containing protein [Candidatus Parcubacteria bacterium]|nr:zinc ribbon domain-containing protein [Candidatus Parcubacteria bacterium]
MFGLKSKFIKKIEKNQGTEDYEEIVEKKTSKLGNVFLVILVIFLFIIGQKVFSDIKDIPEEPIHPAFCVETYSDIDLLRNLNYPQPCYFSEIDKKFNVEKKFRDIEPQINNIIFLNQEISDIQQEIYFNERELDRLLGRYGVGLQEIMVKEKPVIDKPEVKASISSLNEEIASLNQELTIKTKERDDKLNIIEPKLLVLKNSYEQAIDDYKNKRAYFNFIVFLLKLIFVLPLFCLSLYLYFKLKKKNSPHTIIAAAVLTASSILFVEIVLIFLYEILPMEWLIRVFKALMEIAVLKYVIYYGTALLVIAIFGGIVYYIQKKVFDPKKVAIRRLKDNKCPNCSFALNASYEFCPKCGEQIREQCSVCGKLKIKDLPYCPFCGKK